MKISEKIGLSAALSLGIALTGCQGPITEAIVALSPINPTPLTASPSPPAGTSPPCLLPLWSVTGTTVTTIAGTRTGTSSADGPAKSVFLSMPIDVAADEFGNIYIAEANGGRIRRVTPDGQAVTLYDAKETILGVAVTSCGIVFATTGLPGSKVLRIPQDGTARQVGPTFSHPLWGLTVDGDENVYLADPYRSLVLKVRPDGSTSVLAGDEAAYKGDEKRPGLPQEWYGLADGIGTAAKFYEPMDIALGPDGDLFVADSKNSAVRRISKEGSVTTVAGGTRVGGDGSRLYPLGLATGIAVDRDGNSYVADSVGNVVYKVSTAGSIQTLIGTGVRCVQACAGDCPQEEPNKCFSDGPALEARLFSPWGLAVGPSGELLVADEYNGVIRKLM